MSFDDGNFGYDEQDTPDYTGQQQPSQPQYRQPATQTQPQQPKPVYGGLSGLGQALTSAFQQPVKAWMGAGEWVSGTTVRCVTMPSTSTAVTNER